VICFRSQKIDEDLGRVILKCGGSVLESRFDTRIALETALHELLENWPADKRKDSDTSGNWLTE
jgi:hypothetical protein